MYLVGEPRTIVHLLPLNDAGRGAVFFIFSFLFKDFKWVFKDVNFVLNRSESAGLLGLAAFKKQSRVALILSVEFRIYGEHRIKF